MKTNLFKVGLALGAIAAVGCAQKKNETAATTVGTSFSMTASAAPRTVAMKSNIERFMDLFVPKATAGIPTNLIDKVDTVVTLDSAWIVVKEIEFKSAEVVGQESEDEANEEVKFKGPYFVNLVQAQAQVLDTQSIPAKTIRRIEMKLEAAENNASASWPADAPTGLQNNSMYLSGTFGSGNTPFTFSSHDGTEFKVSGAGGIAPQDGQDLLLSIQFADIVRKIDLTALATAGDKNISDSNRVSASNPCPDIEVGLSDLFTCFRKGLESQAEIGNDSDHSGEIESNEDSAKD